MNVALITPWNNAWVPLFEKEVFTRGHEFGLFRQAGDINKPVNYSRYAEPADVCIHGWATGKSVDGARNIMFLRRYELFDRSHREVDWENIDHLIVVNTWIGDRMREYFDHYGYKTPISCIYNSVDLDLWKFKERKPNPWIGMACHIHPKKNLSLALQILAALPQEYELHIAGQVQDPCTAEYLNHVGKRIYRKIYLYGHIERQQLNFWWEQMGFCLSTSLSEGNPNNVIEAMAKGIKPVVHSWPGAEDQFDKSWIFSTVSEAVNQIKLSPYESSRYRDHVRKYFSLDNISKVVDIALEEK